MRSSRSAASHWYLTSARVCVVVALSVTPFFSVQAQAPSTKDPAMEYLQAEMNFKNHPDWPKAIKEFRKRHPTLDVNSLLSGSTAKKAHKRLERVKGKQVQKLVRGDGGEELKFAEIPFVGSHPELKPRDPKQRAVFKKELAKLEKKERSAYALAVDMAEESRRLRPCGGKDSGEMRSTIAVDADKKEPVILADMLFLQTSSQKLDFDFGKKTEIIKVDLSNRQAAQMLRPFQATCVPFRVTMTNGYTIRRWGDKALRNFDTNPLGSGKPAKKKEGGGFD